MALIMSRILLSQPSPTISIVSSSFRHHRNRSNKSHNASAQLIEIDLDSSSSPSDEVITVGIKKLEDAIHGMIVRRAAPDWLPFLPGYSYWVPPRRSSVIKQLPSSQAMLEVLGRFASHNTNNTQFDINNNNNTNEDSMILSEDENMSCVSHKGWPSSSFFTKGNATHAVPVVEMDMKFHDNDENAGNTEEDEEG